MSNCTQCNGYEVVKSLGGARIFPLENLVDEKNGGPVTMAI